MQNDRRRLWSTMLFVILFGTFVVVFILSFILGPKHSQSQAGAPPATSAGPNAAPNGTSGSMVGGGMPATARPEGSQVLAAGDGRDVWMIRPVLGDNNIPGYELFRRSANTGIWRVALRNSGNGTQSFWSTQGLPRALALEQSPPNQSGASTPYILFDSTVPGMLDLVYSGSLEAGNTPQKPLPPNHIIKAATGGRDQLFVITYGPPLAATTRPGDPVQADLLVGATPASQPTATQPATTSAATSTTTTLAAAPETATALTTTTQPAPATRSIFNTYWYPPTPNTTATAPADTLRPSPDDWRYLAPLSPLPGDPASVPTPSSFLTLAQQDAGADGTGARLLAIWVDPLHPDTLVVRSLNYTHPQAQWSAPGTSHLPVPVPADSRLFTLTLDKTIYVLWWVPTAITQGDKTVGNSVALHGGWLKADTLNGPYRLAATIAPMVVDASVGQGTHANDVAVGASENSIVVIAVNRDNIPYSMVFDNRGQPLASVKPVTPELPRRDMQIGQNVAMILLVLMLTLSLWQWRQKPMPVALPKGTIIAPVYLRALAFVIDAALPYAIILLAFGEWDNGGYRETVGRWVGLLSHPEDMLKSVDMFAFLGVYLGHVTLSEMFFRRSLGKSLVGLQVLMLDGKSPTVGAVILRNLVRIPEVAVGVALLYILLSEKRQRLGDLLARTVVVTQEGPEMPEDPDKKE